MYLTPNHQNTSLGALRDRLYTPEPTTDPICLMFGECFGGDHVGCRTHTIMGTVECECSCDCHSSPADRLQADADLAAWLDTLPSDMDATFWDEE